MKQLQTLLLAVTLLFAGTSITSAQAKVAHVNTQELLKTYPAYINAQASAKTAGEAVAKAAEKQYTDMVKAYQDKTKQYNAEANTQTDAVNKSRQQEVLQMQEGIATYERQIQQDVQKAQFEKVSPVQEKVMKAIDKVATTLGFKYVLDRASLVVANGTDITAEVKKELGY